MNKSFPRARKEKWHRAENAQLFLFNLHINDERCIRKHVRERPRMTYVILPL